MKLEEKYIVVPGDKDRIDYEIHFDKKKHNFFIKWRSDWDYLPLVEETDYERLMQLVEKAGHRAIKKHLSLGKKLLIGIKSNAFGKNDADSWDDNSGHVAYAGCSISFGWCIVEDFKTHSDYKRYTILEASNNVNGFNSHYRYLSRWDVFGSGYKVHVLEHTDKNIEFCKNFEVSMQSMVNKVTEVMQDTKTLSQLILNNSINNLIENKNGKHT